MKKKHLPVYWEKLQSVYMYSLIEYKPGEVSDPGPSALDIEQPGGMNILPDLFKIIEQFDFVFCISGEIE